MHLLLLLLLLLLLCLHNLLDNLHPLFGNAGLLSGDEVDEDRGAGVDAEINQRFRVPDDLLSNYPALHLHREIVHLEYLCMVGWEGEIYNY